MHSNKRSISHTDKRKASQPLLMTNEHKSNSPVAIERCVAEIMYSTGNRYEFVFWNEEWNTATATNISKEKLY